MFAYEFQEFSGKELQIPQVQILEYLSLSSFSNTEALLSIHEVEI